MFIAASFHILLLLFELMVSTKLELNIVPFRIVFIPIYGMSVLSIAACVWGYKHERQLEVSMLFVDNLYFILSILLLSSSQLIV